MNNKKKTKKKLGLHLSYHRPTPSVKGYITVPSMGRDSGVRAMGTGFHGAFSLLVVDLVEKGRLNSYW